jgi:hypothetical protein
MLSAPLSRSLVVALVLGGALGGVATSPAAAADPTSCATSGPCIIVGLPNGGVDYLDSDDINADAQAAVTAGAPNAVSDVQYQYDGDAGAGGPYVALGLSVNALMQDVLSPQELAKVTFAEVTVPGAGASHSFLVGGTSPSDLSAPSGFDGPPTAGLLPVFFVNGTEINYVRPLRSSTDNATFDDVESNQAGPIDLDVHTGPLLTVTASTHPSVAKPVKIGAPIVFSASSSGDAVEPQFTWTLSTGEVLSHQQTFTHSFKGTGSTTYEVELSAAGPDDSAGVAAPLFITVGPARYKGNPSPGSTPTPTHSAAPRPTTTPTTPPPTTTGSPGTGTQSTPPTAPTTGSSSGRSGGSTASPQPTPPAQPATSSAGLPLVRGRLIGQTAALVTTPGSVVEATTTGVSPDVRLSGGWRAAAIAGSVAAIMLLFAAGAFRELRWSRRKRSVVRAP